MFTAENYQCGGLGKIALRGQVLPLFSKNFHVYNIQEAVIKYLFMGVDSNMCNIYRTLNARD